MDAIQPDQDYLSKIVYEEMLKGNILDLAEFIVYLSNLFAMKLIETTFHEFLHLVGPDYASPPLHSKRETPYTLAESLTLYSLALKSAVGAEGIYQRMPADAVHACWTDPIIWASNAPQYWNRPPSQGNENAAIELAEKLFEILPGDLTPTEAGVAVNQIGISLHEALFGEQIRALRSKVPVLETGR